MGDVRERKASWSARLVGCKTRPMRPERGDVSWDELAKERDDSGTSVRQW